MFLWKPLETVLETVVNLWKPLATVEIKESEELNFFYNSFQRFPHFYNSLHNGFQRLPQKHTLLEHGLVEVSILYCTRSYAVLMDA